MAGDSGAVGGDDERAAAAGRLHLRGALLGWVLGRLTTPVSNSGEPFFYPSSRVTACLTEMSGLGSDHPDTAQSLNQLALLLHEQGQLAAAKPVLRRALALALGTSAVPPRVARSPVHRARGDARRQTLNVPTGRVVEALSDMERDVRSAGYVRLLASRGSELQGEDVRAAPFQEGARQVRLRSASSCR